MASAAKSEFIVYAPGLLGPFSGQEHWPVNDWPDLPLLEKLLSRADHLKQQTLVLDDESRLFSYFNLDINNHCLPMAAVCLLAEGGSPTKDCWLRLDAVCVQADRTDAVLVAHRELSLSDAEADALQDSIRPLLEEWSISLRRTTTHHWYACLDKPDNLVTTPLQHVQGQGIGQYMPTGSDHRRWHSFMNEVQMLWHSHPVNLQREQQGQLPVSSVWPWGCGVLPEKSDVAYDAVYSDDLMAQGLAVLNGIESLPLSELMHSDLQGRQLLVDLSWRARQQKQDVAGWFEALTDWHNTILQALVHKLQQDQQLKITFDFGSEFRYSLTSKTLRRWWRKTIPLHQLISPTA